MALMTLILSFGAGTCLAQFSGQVQGNVQDASGAAVPNAQVSITNAATADTRQTNTDTQGNYIFLSLSPGSYSVRVTANGFADAETRFTLGTEGTQNIPFRLAPASVSTKVEVTSVVQGIDTADSRNQLTLTSKTLETLPLQANSMFSIMDTIPGVVGTGNLSSGSLYANATTAPVGIGAPIDNVDTVVFNDVVAMGRGYTSNQYLLDGIDITNPTRDGVASYLPNPDAIQESSFQVNTFDVEHGRSSAIETVMTTKYGSQQFHGQASWYYSYEDLWNATEFGRDYAPFHTNNISATLGGPILPSHRFFFFVAVEPIRGSSSTGDSVVTYNDPAFTQWAVQNFPNTVGTQVLQSYPVGKAVKLTSVAQTAQDIFPGTCGTAATYNLPCGLPMVDDGVFNASPGRNGLQWSFRIDKSFDKDRLYFSYLNTGVTIQTLGARPAFNTTTKEPGTPWQLGWTHTFNERTLNEAGFGAAPVSGNDSIGGEAKVPTINVTGITGFGVGFANGKYVQHDYHWREVLTRIQGKHTIKVGYDGGHANEYTNFDVPNSNPTFSFTNPLNLVTDNPYTETGIAYNPITGKQGGGSWDNSISTNAIFVQDAWRVKPNLTLNFGLRWDDYGNAHGVGGHSVPNFYLGTGSTFDQQVANGAIIDHNKIFNNSQLGWSPRFGAAWDPFKNGHWVVRGGFGMYHDWVTLGAQEVNTYNNPPGTFSPVFFSNGSTAAPIFALGTSNTYPFGFTYPTPTTTTLDSKGGLVGDQVAVGGVDPNLPISTTFNYTVAAEHELTGRLIAGVEYQGSHTYNEMWGFGQSGNEAYGFNINKYSGDLYAHASTTPTGLNSSFGAITYTGAGVNSTYNGLVLTLRGQFNHGFFNASYGYSHVNDDSQVYPTNNISQYYGPSNFDAPNHFALTWHYDIPGFEGGRGLGFVLDGWSLSGTTVLQSGRPWSVYTTNPFDPVITTNADGTKTVTGLKPDSGDYNGDGYNYDFPDVQSYKMQTSRNARLHTGVFSAAQFTQPGVLGAEGNEAINRFRAPAYYNSDFVLQKTFRIYENYQFRIGGDYFNAFNHPNLLTEDQNLADPNFGKCIGQTNPRWLQLFGKFVF
jgi:hypothetical protein